MAFWSKSRWVREAVLFGFRPLYRAQSWAPYIPMTNALLLSSVTPGLPGRDRF
jgi:hypothetical protein